MKVYFSPLNVSGINPECINKIKHIDDWRDYDMTVYDEFDPHAPVLLMTMTSEEAAKCVYAKLQYLSITWYYFVQPPTYVFGADVYRFVLTPDYAEIAYSGGYLDNAYTKIVYSRQGYSKAYDPRVPVRTYGEYKTLYTQERTILESPYFVLIFNAGATVVHGEPHQTPIYTNFHTVMMDLDNFRKFLRVYSRQSPFEGEFLPNYFSKVFRDLYVVYDVADIYYDLTKKSSTAYPLQFQVASSVNKFDTIKIGGEPFEAFQYADLTKDVTRPFRVTRSVKSTHSFAADELAGKWTYHVPFVGDLPVPLAELGKGTVNELGANILYDFIGGTVTARLYIDGTIYRPYSITASLTNHMALLFDGQHELWGLWGLNAASSIASTAINGGTAGGVWGAVGGAVVGAVSEGSKIVERVALAYQATSSAVSGELGNVSRVDNDAYQLRGTYYPYIDYAKFADDFGYPDGKYRYIKDLIGYAQIDYDPSIVVPQPYNSIVQPALERFRKGVYILA